MLLNKRISIVYFVNLIKIDLALIVCYTIVTSLIRHFSSLHSLSIPLSLAALLGTLISLLLAFRVSQSYERWWEARVVWGSIVNDSRTLLRQLKQFLPKDNPTTERHLKDFSQRQIIWVNALGESLRKKEHSSRVHAYIHENKLVGSNIPNLILEKHSEKLAELSEQYQLNENKQVQIDSTIVRLTEAMGKCERIKNTVFPRSYTVLIQFIIYTFITIFPFGLSEVGEITEAILSILIPLLFVAIEKTALVMQDPFENRPTDTPMTNLAQVIERSLNDALGEEAPVQDSASGSYYVM